MATHTITAPSSPNEQSAPAPSTGTSEWLAHREATHFQGLTKDRLSSQHFSHPSRNDIHATQIGTHR